MIWLSGMSISLLAMRYIMVTLATSLRCWRESQPRSWSMVVPGIVIHYIPCCTPLNGFDLVNTLLGRWRPYTTGIFCNWPHKGVVTTGFDFRWAGTKVATEEAKGSLSFHSSGFQMLVPGQVSEFNSQVFGWLNCLERVAMDGIGEIHWIMTLGDVKYLALFKMKFMSHCLSHFCSASRSCWSLTASSVLLMTQ